MKRIIVVNGLGKKWVMQHVGIVFALCMVHSIQLVNAAETLTISPEQFQNLGVIMGQLTPVNEVPLLSAPAVVTIPPAHDYLVSASQAGLITKLQASVGDSVKQGAVLAQIDSPDLLALQGQYLKATSIMKLASATYQRDKKLFKEGVIANRREQETFSAYNAAVLDVNEARQLLLIAGMSPGDIKHLAQTHQLSSQFAVRAPVTGVILERMTVVGTRVDRLAPLYRVANLSELWLDIAIPQEKIGSIKVGDTVRIDNTQLSAEIRLLGQSINPENQTLLARAVIKGKQADVRAGQRITVQILQATQSESFNVANTAIAQNEGKAFVFIQTPTGFDVNPIKVVGKLNDSSIIQGNFSGDEKIAVKGAVALKAVWLGLGSEE